MATNTNPPNSLNPNPINTIPNFNSPTSLNPVNQTNTNRDTNFSTSIHPISTPNPTAQSSINPVNPLINKTVETNFLTSQNDIL